MRLQPPSPNFVGVFFFFIEKEKKKKKEDAKVRSPIADKAAEAKSESRVEEQVDKKKEKPKIQRTTAPSHAKFRSTGE